MPRRAEIGPGADEAQKIENATIDFDAVAPITQVFPAAQRSTRIDRSARPTRAAADRASQHECRRWRCSRNAASAAMPAQRRWPTVQAVGINRGEFADDIDGHRQRAVWAVISDEIPGADPRDGRPQRDRIVKSNPGIPNSRARTGSQSLPAGSLSTMRAGREHPAAVTGKGSIRQGIDRTGARRARAGLAQQIRLDRGRPARLAVRHGVVQDRRPAVRRGGRHLIMAPILLVRE